MVIVECCAWCGGPHPTVVNCPNASWVKEMVETGPVTANEYEDALAKHGPDSSNGERK